MGMKKDISSGRSIWHHMFEDSVTANKKHGGLGMNQMDREKFTQEKKNENMYQTPWEGLDNKSGGNQFVKRWGR